MVKNNNRQIPRFIIDDTAEPGDARVFIMHTISPRFVAELIPANESFIGVGTNVSFSLASGDSCCVLEFYDEPALSDAEASELCHAIDAVLSHHFAIRDSPDYE